MKTYLHPIKALHNIVKDAEAVCNAVDRTGNDDEHLHRQAVHLRMACEECNGLLDKWTLTRDARCLNVALLALHYRWQQLHGKSADGDKMQPKKGLSILSLAEEMFKPLDFTQSEIVFLAREYDKNQSIKGLRIAGGLYP
jgi:hypothetical protein